MTPPVHWPSLTAVEALEEWNDLRYWVESLQRRYLTSIRLPDCWWRHNEIVELLAALRDHERASFGCSALGSGGMEWQRARREAETQLEIWIKRLTCTVPGRGHSYPTTPDEVPDGWLDFVLADADRRHAEESARCDDDPCPIDTEDETQD